MRPPATLARKAGGAILLAVAALLLLATAAQAGTVPSGFQESTVFSGLTQPTSLAFSPDGRVFVAEKSGIIKVYENLNDTTPEVVANLTTEVYDYWDRGLLGMALDPDFPAKPYLYVLYTLDAPPGGTVPTWGGTSPSDGCPTPPGPTTNGCVATGRLAKLTLSGNKMVANTPLITDWCQQFPSHSIGDLGFGADGSLYVSGGDGANFNAIDWGQSGEPLNPCGDPPGGVGGAMTLPTAEGGSLRAQDLRTPADPTGLDGSLLRVNPETGQAMPENPLSSSLDANARRIVAYGMRNPFRFTVRPGTNEVWVGDVGLSNWEEIDRVANPTGSTPYNFGWPCYEGANGTSARQSSWDAANANLCESLYSEGPSAVAAPYYAYKHSANVVSGDTCAPGSSSISGLAFYESGPFPNSYNGALFFADYSRNCIWAMMPGANGLPNPNNIQVFDAGAGAPVNLVVGPDGALYFPDFNSGKIWRIGHAVGNQPPVAEATATPQDGPGPLSVQLSAAGSSDPDPGDTLSYSWDLNGDGQFGDSTQVSPTHVYTEPGVHVATVRVTDPDGATDTASVSIQVDNAPPTATITAPAPTLTWAVGDQIAFSATATDPQQGTLPASAYSWNVIIHHCPSTCHLHQEETITGKSSGVIVAPDHEYPSWLELKLTVTDNGGLTDTESVAIYPKTVSLGIQTVPTSGFEVSLDSNSGPSPLSETVIKGSDNTVSAPAQTLGGTEYAFGAWSDGGSATHNVIANENLTLKVVYGPPAAPTITATSPAAPANDNNPEVKGTVGADFPGQVKVFTNSNCSGSAAATGTPAQFTGAGITTPVPGDATTPISAVTTNSAGNSKCSNSLNYVEDSTPPAAPSITSTTPPSPANNNSPSVKGSAESGSTVRIFKSANCSGTAAVTGSAAQFSSGLTVAVSDNTDTSLTATATDAAGNTSACSSALTYTEDSTPPAAPTITATTPASPANDNSPEVSGSVGTGSPTTIKLYASANCSGTSTTATVATFTGSGITATVPSNQTTTFSARAIDAAGNESACSSSFNYAEDSTPPAAPSITATTPASPSNNNRPSVKGSAESGSTVRLFKSANCSGTAAATGSAAQFAAGLTVAVSDDTDTSLTATATDAAGNTSACSSAFTYTEDSTPPAAPSITATTPASPANNNSPSVKGSAESGSTVRLYKSANCSGTAAATGSAAQFAAGLTVTVAGDTNTQLTATATDAAGNASPCSSALTYVEDSTPPTAPSIVATSPASPANDNNPEVSGAAESGSTVRLYRSANCSGTAAVTGSAAQFAAGLTLAVSNDTSNSLTATATDAAGNTSACSSALTYVEDSTPPAAPSITATSPASPANNNSPSVKGSAESGSTVRIFKSANCSGTAAVTGSAAQFSSGLVVTVDGDTDTSLTATATDAAGNVSPCSSALTYVEDSTAPAAPSITATSPASPANNNTPDVSGTAESGATVRIFKSANCSGTAAATGSAAQFAAGLTVAVSDDTDTSLTATATDVAGNTSACSGSLTYTEDSTAPAAPSITATSPASPANDNSPEVKGTAGTGSPTKVELYATANCTGAPVTAAVATFTAAGITVTVPDNQTSAFSARDSDAAGNESSCSSSFSYVEDSTLPEAPTIAGTSPASPANDSSPKVSGNAESASTVRIFENGDCSGTAAATGSAAEFATGLTVPVGDNTTTTLTATATDAASNSSACSQPIFYTEDSTAPAVPGITASSPSGPANDNDPVLRGNADGDSTVRIYESANCSGPIAAQGTAAEFASGLSLPVADDTTSSFTATATDMAGNVSGCSPALTYTEDSTAPAPPQISASDPASPSNNSKPKLSGKAEAGSTVQVFESADCSGQPAATGNASGLADGLTVTVPENANTALTAKATDAAGNVSGCSTGLTYTEDSIPPQTTITKAPSAHVSVAPKQVRGRAGVRGSFSFKSNEASAHFFCKVDEGPFAPCTSPVTRSKFKMGPHRFQVRAVDAAGNVDPTPATRKFSVVAR
jgi:glucose/arabinose dehydrogenase